MDPRVRADKIRQRLQRMNSDELLREGALKAQCVAPLLCEHGREPGNCAMCDILDSHRFFCTACKHEFSSAEGGKRACQSVAQFQALRTIAFEDEVVSRKITEAEIPEPDPAPAPSPRPGRPTPPEDARARRERERRERERRRREEEERHRLVLERLRIAWRHFWTTLDDRWNRLMQMVYPGIVHGTGFVSLLAFYTGEGFASLETGLLSLFLFFIPALFLYALIYHERFGRWNFRKCVAAVMVLTVFPGLQGISTLAFVESMQWWGLLVSAGLWLLFFRSATVVAYQASDRMTRISPYPGRTSSVHGLVYAVSLVMALVTMLNPLSNIGSNFASPTPATPPEIVAPSPAAPAATQSSPRAEKEPTPVKSTMRFELTVDTQPSDARVMIMNIKQKYSPGISLSPGRYHVKMVHPRCTDASVWVQLPASEQAPDAEASVASGAVEVSHRIYRLDSVRRAMVLKAVMECPGDGMSKPANTTSIRRTTTGFPSHQAT